MSYSHIPKILIVEDDEGTRFMLKEYLSSAFEIEITYATCVSEGKCQFTQNRFDLIICDQNMSDGLGTEVLHFVRESDQVTPFFLFSAQGRDDLPYIDPNLNCRYIQKPAVSTLIREVERHLGSRHDRE